MNKVLIIISFIAVMLLSGCTPDSAGSKNNGFSLNSFNGGQKALSMEFAELSPPEKVMDQALQPFSIRILVENHGEYDIPSDKAFVTLTGFNPSDLNITETSKTLMGLNGYKKQGDNVIPGAKQQVVFNDLRYKNSIGSGSYPFKFYANICYPYETKSFALICINGNTIPAINKKTEICKLEGEKEFANSGAPIKISNVRQYPMGAHSIQIQFDIIHTPISDQSNLYQRDSIDSNCRIDGISPSSPDALFKQDKVTYIVESGIDGLNCESTGTNTRTVSLTGNQYTVTCIQDTQDQEEYEKPISITLQYDYLDRISKTIMIEHVSKN